MQIKVTPEVLGNNSIKFQQSWVQALKEAEETLSTCIEQHLTEYIQGIDQLICTRVNEILHVLLEANVNDPMELLKPLC